MKVGSYRLCAHACLYLQLINTLQSISTIMQLIQTSNPVYRIIWENETIIELDCCGTVKKERIYHEVLDHGEIRPMSLIFACDLTGLRPMDLNQAVLILPCKGHGVLWVPILAFISQFFDLQSHRESRRVSLSPMPSLKVHKLTQTWQSWRLD